MVLALLVAIAALVLAMRSRDTANEPIPPDQGPPLPTGFDETTVTNTGNLSQGVLDFAQAIARAEGYGIAGAIPTRANNPGDLVMPNWSGATLGAERISVFESPEAGWQALYHQLMLIVLGKSHVYKVDMTFAEMAGKWTHTQTDAWTINVLTYLVGHGYEWLESDSTIGEVLLT